MKSKTRIFRKLQSTSKRSPNRFLGKFGAWALSPTIFFMFQVQSGTVMSDSSGEATTPTGAVSGIIMANVT